MKRVRKAKADEVDDGSSREEIPGAHSILEISGPTIPSPGPSGTLCVQHEGRKEKQSRGSGVK